VCRKKEQFKAVAIRLQAIQKAKVGEEAAERHLEFLKILKELKSEEQKEQAIDLCKKYMEKQHLTDKELAEHIEASQVESGRLKAIQSTSKQTRSVSGSAAKLASELLGLFGIDANEAFVAIEAFCGRSGGESGGEAVAIQSTLTARDITSFKDFADAFRIRVLTMLPLNLWFAFRLAIIGKVVYYRDKKSYDIMWTKPSDVADWMEFTLEYTMAPRRQLRRLWLVLRLFFIGGALLCFAFFISTVLYLPIDPSGPNPFALWILFAANLLAAALVFTRANRGRVVAWLGTLGKTDDADNKAAALAALVGSLSAAKAFQLGIENFKTLYFKDLKQEDVAGRKAGTVAGDWKTSPGWPTQELYDKTIRVGQPGGPKFGEVDAFISHSWSDDGVAKFECLEEWAEETKAKTGEEVTIWLDKACLDQRDIQASLAGLPVFISGCKHLLVLAGETYASRLWCVIELFVFVQLGRNVKEEMIVKLLNVSDTPDRRERQGRICRMQEPELEPAAVKLDAGSATATSEPLDVAAAPIAEPPDLHKHPILEQWEYTSNGSIAGRVYGETGFKEGEQMTTSFVPEKTRYATYVITGSGSIYRLGEKLLQNKTAEGLLKFDASTAETFDPNDRQRLLAVIEASFGTFTPFNKIIRATYPTAKLKASAVSVLSGGSLTLTPTFENGMDVRITSDDGSSDPIFVRRNESGRASTVTPTKSPTKYTLTVESPNGIKVSTCVTIKFKETVEIRTSDSPLAKRKSLEKKASSRNNVPSTGNPSQVHPAPA
jgi:hypothetical protein